MRTKQFLNAAFLKNEPHKSAAKKNGKIKKRNGKEEKTILSLSMKNF